MDIDPTICIAMSDLNESTRSIRESHGSWSLQPMNSAGGSESLLTAYREDIDALTFVPITPFTCQVWSLGRVGSRRKGIKKA